MKPYLILFIGVLSVSFAAIFIRLAEAPPLVIATYRFVILPDEYQHFAMRRFEFCKPVFVKMIPLAATCMNKNQ